MALGGRRNVAGRAEEVVTRKRAVPHHIRNLLADLGIKPVLVDIGASGEPPPIWNEIAAQSTYIGFDPDAREIHTDRLSQYHASVIINEAVTEHLDRSVIPFYLTKSPFCSTTLGPNPEATAHWLERDKFVVESETTLRATTIDAALARQKLSTIDWIKLDTQGTDLRSDSQHLVAGAVARDGHRYRAGPHRDLPGRGHVRGCPPRLDEQRVLAVRPADRRVPPHAADDPGRGATRERRDR